MEYKKHFDVIVVGLGAMGSSTLYHLAQEGKSVLGIDQFDPPHNQGSSHGQTRVTRLANGEGDEYSKLALYARPLWQELEAKSGQQLLVENGILIFGNPAQQVTVFESQNFLSKTVEQAEKYTVKHAVYGASEIAQKFPQFNLTGSEIGYHEPTGGYLLPEKCISAQLDIAVKNGAHKLIDTIVKNINFNDNPIKIATSRGDFTCDKVIVSAGSWLSTLFPEFVTKFDVYRQVAIWFKLKGAEEQYGNKAFPTFKWKFVQGNVMGIYGFPMVGSDRVVKIGIEDYNAKIDVAAHTPEVNHRKVMELYEEYIKERMPMISPEYVHASACIYTVAKDWKFVIDYYPTNRNVIVASPCSGHGFKHSIGIGKILANMCTGQQQPFDIVPFALDN